jgi:class 3 adenylate cyclase
VADIEKDKSDETEGEEHSEINSAEKKAEERIEESPPKTNKKTPKKTPDHYSWDTVGYQSSIVDLPGLYPTEGIFGTIDTDLVLSPTLRFSTGDTFLSQVSGQSDVLKVDDIISSMRIDSDSVLKSFQIFDDTSNLKKERLELLGKLNKATEELLVHKRDKEKLKVAKEETDKDKQRLIEVNKEINKKLTLGNLITQVNADARKKLFESEDFIQLFETIGECNAYVVSIDIRRSTELMLKAKHPRLFERFIVSLCRGLSEIIISNYGIFDKFTGDGILAFFPDFFSGKDAGLMAVKSSVECHEFFKHHYTNNRHCFASVLLDTGLGIGIDYGKACLVSMSGSYTVVGNPVVYACRLSGGDAEQTLLNQTAYEEIFREYKQFLNIEETSIVIKHEGNVLAYEVASNGEPMKFERPDWDQLIEEHLDKNETT